MKTLIATIALLFSGAVAADCPSITGKWAGEYTGSVSGWELSGAGSFRFWTGGGATAVAYESYYGTSYVKNDSYVYDTFRSGAQCWVTLSSPNGTGLGQGIFKSKNELVITMTNPASGYSAVHVLKRTTF